MIFPFSQFEDRQENVTKNMEKLNKEKSLLLVEVGKLGQEADVCNNLSCSFSFSI